MMTREHKEQIKEIVTTMRSNGKLWSEVADTLNAKKIPTKTGIPWSRSNANMFAVQNGWAERTRRILTNGKRRNGRVEERRQNGKLIQEIGDIITSNLSDDTKVKVVQILARESAT